jgi:Zn-dependent protease
MLLVLLGIADSALFILSLFLHELGHAVAARRSGIPVKAMRFFVFGGLTEMQRRAESPRQELAIALAGPLVSATLGALLVLVAWRGTGDTLLLGQINWILAGFNLLPVFPLDGGRALRAVLWKTSGDFERGTRQAIGCARFVIYAMIAAGIGYALLYSAVAGFLFVLIAWRLRLRHENSVPNFVADPAYSVCA